MAAFNNSSVINLKLTTSTSGIQTPTAPMPASYEVYLTDWSSTPSTITTSRTEEALPIASIGGAIGITTITTVYGANQSLSITLNKSSIASYLSTHSNQLKLLIDPHQVLTPGNSLISDFQALPSGNAGTLQMDGDLPIPEPSSMLLGFISLGGLYKARKRKTTLRSA